MRLSDLLTTIGSGYSRLIGPDPEITAVTDDSRKVVPGSAFVAIRGERSDGHDFITSARLAGAAAVFSERALDLPSGIALVRVDDAPRTLARAASVMQGFADLQARGEYRVVGITGTNGKSTTAFLVQAMLAHAGTPTALLGTVLYDLVGRRMAAPMTTPPAAELTAMLAESHTAAARAAAIEVSSHSLAQRRIDGIDFRVGVFTNLTGDHLDYHGTMAEYLAAKKRLFDMLPTHATAVVNADDPNTSALLGDCKASVLRFGLESLGDLPGGRGCRRAGSPGGSPSRTLDSGLWAVDLDLTAAGSRFTVHHQGRTHRVASPLLGRHNVQNLLAAIGAGLGMGLDLAAACDGAARVANVRGRLERVPTHDLGFGVVVDYAHTDDALQNVLAALRPITRGRLWCVFGCGGDRDRTKRPRMARAAAAGADRVIVTSDNPRSEDPDAIIAEIRAGFATDDLPRCDFETDRGRAIGMAVSQAQRDDTVLIAGKGHEDYQILGARRIHFDDVEVAAEAVQRRQPAG